MNNQFNATGSTKSRLSEVIDNGIVSVTKIRSEKSKESKYVDIDIIPNDNPDKFFINTVLYFEGNLEQQLLKSLKPIFHHSCYESDVLIKALIKLRKKLLKSNNKKNKSSFIDILDEQEEMIKLVYAYRNSILAG